MAEQKIGVANTTPPNPTPAAAATATAQPEKITPPQEIVARGGAIKIVRDGKDVTIDIDPMIVQEVGSYQRCKVRIAFQEGGGVRVLPFVQQ